MNTDWQQVVDLSPQGYCEVREETEGVVYHGHLSSIVISDGGNVVIRLKWSAKMILPERDGYDGKWVKSEVKEFDFPNGSLLFEIENTPEKGKRVRAGAEVIIYLEPQDDNHILEAISTSE